MMDIEILKYPIGKYNPGDINTDRIKNWTEELRVFPQRLTSKLRDIDAEKLKYTYRPEGWNIQQLVHHLADSHMNSIIRFKWTLTEDNPTIKPYFEAEWAKLHDVKQVPIEASLKILSGVHERLAALLSNMGELDFARTLIHPEHGLKMDLAYLTGMYVWHGNHHLAHIQAALKLKKKQW
jgi:hypothetical protein